MESTVAQKDKRLSPRVRLQCPLRFHVIPVREAGFKNAFAYDISQTGFRFHSMAFLPKRSSFLVEMEPPGHAPIHSLARAVWVRERPLEEGYEVGGMFIEPPHDARTTIGKIVSGG
jgi:hypothetical protein